MKYSEFKRWLEQQGASFSPGKGSHLARHAEWQNLHLSVSCLERDRQWSGAQDQKGFGPEIANRQEYR